MENIYACVIKQIEYEDLKRILENLCGQPCVYIGIISQLLTVIMLQLSL